MVRQWFIHVQVVNRISNKFYISLLCLNKQINRLGLFDIHISLIHVLRLKAYTSTSLTSKTCLNIYSYFDTIYTINLTNLLSYVILLKKKVFNNLNRRCEMKFDFWHNAMVWCWEIVYGLHARNFFLITFS